MTAPDWRPIATAPKDRLVWVYVAAYPHPCGELPAFQGVCEWHDEAGWCMDELREATHWLPLGAITLEPPRDAALARPAE